MSSDFPRPLSPIYTKLAIAYDVVLLQKDRKIKVIM